MIGTARSDVLDAAIQHLRDAGLRVTELPAPVGGDPGVDALVEIAGPAGARRYAVEIRSRVPVASVATVQSSRYGPTLVVAPHISDAVGAALRRHDIHFADAAGNAYLSWEGMLLDVRGRRLQEVPRPGDAGRPLRAFRTSGIRILFVLLAEPEGASTSYREIAQASGTSLGTVQWVLKELEETGHISTGTTRKLHRQRDLFNRWVEAYALDLHPRLTLGEFDTPDLTWWTGADDVMLATHSQWGGETAVHRIYRRLRPGKATVYASSVPRRLATEYRFRKADGPGNVEVRQRFWTTSDRPSGLVVPSPLIYADLVASGEPRQLEAAAYLREHDALLRRLDHG